MAQAARDRSDAAAPAPSAEVTLTDFDPDGELKVVAAALYPHSDQSRPVASRCRPVALDADERAAVLRASVGDRIEPPPQARPRLRAHELPVRRAHRLRRVPRPAAAPAADDRLADAVDAPWLHRAGGARRRRRRRRVAGGHGPVGRAARRAGRRPDWRPSRRTPCRWPIASAS